jgi:hypothetical protein
MGRRNGVRRPASEAKGLPGGTACAPDIVCGDQIGADRPASRSVPIANPVRARSLDHSLPTCAAKGPTEFSHGSEKRDTPRVGGAIGMAIDMGVVPLSLSHLQSFNERKISD